MRDYFARAIAMMRLTYRIWKSGHCVAYIQMNAERSGDDDYRLAAAQFVVAHGVWMRAECAKVLGPDYYDEIYQDEK